MAISTPTIHQHQVKIEALGVGLSVTFVFCVSIRDGPFNIKGGGWDFFEKNSSFPNRSEKNKISSTKLKIKCLFFIQFFFGSPFPGSY